MVPLSHAGPWHYTAARLALSQLRHGVIVRGPALPEPIEVLVVSMFGDMVKIVGARNVDLGEGCPGSCSLRGSSPVSFGGYHRIGTALPYCPKGIA